MSRTLLRGLGLFVLLSFYAAAWLAPLLAPYSHRHQFRDFALAPPSSFVFESRFGTGTPAIQARRRVDLKPTYEPTGELVSIRFFPRSEPYSWMGMEFETRLFGSSDESQPVFLLGTDELGRDLFSRILFGSRYSLSIGLTTICLTLFLGVVMGSLSGYFEGWTDRIVMRISDLFLSLPALFLVLGVRAIFPELGGRVALYFLIVGIFALLGWASVARVIRGQVLSLKEREHVLYAVSCGASPWWVLRRHILPFSRNFLLVQGSVLLPAYIMGEVTLTFLGLGVQEPDVSWGNLLQDAVSLRALGDCPWLLTPAVAALLVVLAFNYLADELKLITGQERSRGALGL